MAILLKHQQEQPSREAAACHRAEDGDPAVVPAAVALARDGKDGVGAAGAQVTGGVHRVAGGAAKGHAQGHDEAGDGPGADRAGGGRRTADLEGIALEADGEDHEHQQRRSDELGEEVPPGIPNSRHGAEGAEHGVGFVGGGLVVVLIEHIDQQGAHETTQHLGDDVTADGRPGELAGDGKAQRHSRIQVRTGNRAGDEDAHHHGKAPRKGDDDPSAALGFGLVQGSGGAYAVAEEHQDEGADEFEDICVHSHLVNVLDIASAQPAFSSVTSAPEGTKTRSACHWALISSRELQ